MIKENYQDPKYLQKVFDDRNRPSTILVENTILNRWKKFILMDCLSPDSISGMKTRLLTQVASSKNARELISFCDGLYRDTKEFLGYPTKPYEFKLGSYANVN